MESVLKRFKKKELEIKLKVKRKSLFTKVEEIHSRKIYHTKIMNDFYAFGIDDRKKDKFFISFRGLFNQEKITPFNLFSLKENDEFLGIFYGYRKPLQNIVKKYEENGIVKTTSFSKIYYIEFRFKKGSIYCYVKGIYRLVRKDKSDTKYCKSLIEKLLKLEKEVHYFFNKKFPKEGIITRWIEKNQK